MLVLNSCFTWSCDVCWPAGCPAEWQPKDPNPDTSWPPTPGHIRLHRTQHRKVFQVRISGSQPCCFRLRFCFCSTPLAGRSFMAAMMGISALRSHHPLPLSTARPATALPRATSPTSHQPSSLTPLRCRCRCRRSLPHSCCSSSPRASLSPGAPDSAAFMALAPNNAALRHRLIAPNSTAGSGDAAATGGLPSVSARSLDRESNNRRRQMVHSIFLSSALVCMYV